MAEIKNNICTFKQEQGKVKIIMTNGEEIPMITDVMIEQDQAAHDERNAYATIRLAVMVAD
jgi:hypothetical protein